MQINNQLKGFLYILTADILWGLSATLAKYLFNRQISPLDLAQLRIVLSFIVLAAALAVTNPKLIRIERRDIPYIIVLGTFGLAAVQFTYLYTISETNVATAVFLEYLAPVFILLYGLASRKESVNTFKLLALFSATFGGLLIVKGTTGQGMAVTIPGLISGLASAVTFGFYTVYGKYGLSKYSAWTLMLWAMGAGSLVWTVYQPPWVTFFSYGSSDWLFFLYIAVFATILPFVFYFKGLNCLSPLVTGITSTMEPVIAGIISFFILGEVLTPVQLTGCALIIGAIVLLQLKNDSKCA